MKTKNVASIIAVVSALFFQVLAPGTVRAAQAAVAPLRQTLSLDGTWQVAEGKMDVVPSDFAHAVPVPGLVDMAEPPFVEPGPKVADRNQVAQKDPRRDAFWYRRTFTVHEPIPAVAALKIGKAMFGTRVFLNGKLLGDHAPCFTPGWFDAKAALRAGENELLVRVGADRDAVGHAIPDGFDFEKTRYIPGIFDSVELVLCGAPNIENIQVAPDITNRQARVRVWLKGVAAPCEVTIEIREVKSGRTAARATVHASPLDQTVDVAVPIASCHLWSPESPFLYELTARTSGDEFKSRFGMREFKFDPVSGRAMLNGKPYFMRGSNITLYRFFEDSECGALPWNESWVRRLHQRIKDMHWNCLRYCIGFPPECWYRIADEEGILIQDEFPIWFGGSGWSKMPKEFNRAELAVEYAEWMRERWNHPSVVIWDASNETTSDETSPAVAQVRSLDVSGRPWDNSYMPPGELGDVLEQHPYHFSNANYKLSELATANSAPWGQKGNGHGVVINEYGWLWLNRDGTPTTLTEKLYRNLLGTNSTTAQRRQLYARYTAAETEFWRAHRTAAAVMHFTTLGYARADGQTSDNWMPGSVAKLEWEPEFHKYVRDAFAPVGLMLDYWNESALPGAGMPIPVTLINDLPAPWSGPVILSVKSGGRVLAEKKLKARIAAFGTTNVLFNLTWPEQTGPCILDAELRGADGEPVHSVRDVTIKPQ
jgi:beta-galactosidase